MFREVDHPRDNDGKFTDGNSGHSEKLEKAIDIYSDNPKADKENARIAPDVVRLPDETLPRSLSARWANYPVRMPDGTTANFVEGSKLHHKEVFAGKGTRTVFNDAPKYVKRQGGNFEDWQKIKAIGTLENGGEPFDAEVHWVENPVLGVKDDWKFKRYV